MADSGKKQKLTKAEKEKQKREEAERKAQEEEAARLKALEDANKAKEEEAAKAIEKAKQDNTERRTRRLDMTELDEILSEVSRQLNELDTERRKQSKWDRYMLCDGSPDPVNQGEINTYINLRYEDKTRDSAEHVLKDSLLDLELIRELEYLLEDTPLSELSKEERLLYKETINDLENLMMTKLDLASLYLICDATKLADTETGNLQTIVRNDHICLCAWGNLIKNPRIKNFEFEDIHFTFDIPRVLSLSDCAVRLLWTRFDHFSKTSKSSFPRRKIVEPPTPPPVQEKKEEEQQQENEEDPTETPKEEVKEESELDLMAALRGEEVEEEEDEEEEEEVMEEDYADPKTPEPEEWEDFDEDDEVVDLRAYDVLGGIFSFNLYHMPPQPKTAGEWTITQIVDPPTLQTMEYTGETSNSSTDVNAKDKSEKKDEKPAIGITMVLPEDVYYQEEPQVARWDAQRKLWTTNGFNGFEYKEEARTFHFKTVQFGTICLMQDSHINMPFQSWEIRPHDVNSAVLTIIAAIVQIEIEIKGALCCLSEPKYKSELDHIRNVWMTPNELIKSLKKAGINVFPNEDSSKFVTIQNKHRLVEERMYQQMALTSSAMAYSWSKWNGEIEKDMIIVQASEALEDQPLVEEDWWVMMATKRRVLKLKMTEYDDTFIEETEEQEQSFITPQPLQNKRKRSSSQTSGLSSQHHSPSTGTGGRVSPKTNTSSKTSRATSSYLAQRISSSHKRKKDKIKEEDEDIPEVFRVFNRENSVYRSNIYHLMKQVSSEAALKRVADTDFMFINCVHQLLKATKVLNYS